MSDVPSGLAGQWLERLRPEFAGYATVALDNIVREFPFGLYVAMREPGDFPQRPSDRYPVFYGSYDWQAALRCSGSSSGS